MNFCIHAYLTNCFLSVISILNISQLLCLVIHQTYKTTKNFSHQFFSGATWIYILSFLCFHIIITFINVRYNFFHLFLQTFVVFALEFCYILFISNICIYLVASLSDLNINIFHSFCQKILLVRSNHSMRRVTKVHKHAARYEDFSNNFPWNYLQYIRSGLNH